MSTALNTGTASGSKTFEYRVRDRDGRLVTGKLEAPNQSAVVVRLREMGYAPIAISQKRTGGLNTEIGLPGLNRVGLKDLAVMARQFATMISSGLSLLRALSILAEQTESTRLREAVSAVRNDIEAGVSLSTALAKHPTVFPPLMINMCRAGEVGGFLDQTLIAVADNFESEVKLRGKVKAAMTYPIVVFVIALLAVVVMLVFIVPVFAAMFADLGSELPAPTKALVWLSQVMTYAGPVLIVLGVVAALGWGRVRHRHEVRAVLDPLRLRLPIFGRLFAKVALSRFARNLSTMLRSGVPILQSLEIVGETSGNLVLERAAKDVQDSVRQGDSLAAPLAAHPVFPAMMVQMLSVGEDTGALDSMLSKLADFYDQEVESTTESLTSVIEPLMIAVLGSVVGAMIIALYLPIFSVFNAIQ